MSYAATAYGTTLTLYWQGGHRQWRDSVDGMWSMDQGQKAAVRLAAASAGVNAKFRYQILKAIE